MVRQVTVLDGDGEPLGEMTCTMPHVVGSGDRGDGLLVGSLRLQTTAGNVYWLVWGPAHKRVEYRVTITGTVKGASGYYFHSCRV
jgi:hypothetical protein